MDVDGTLIRLISFFQRLLASTQEAPKENPSGIYVIFATRHRFHICRDCRILDYIARNMWGPMVPDIILKPAATSFITSLLVSVEQSRDSGTYETQLRVKMRIHAYLAVHLSQILKTKFDYYFKASKYIITLSNSHNIKRVKFLSRSLSRSRKRTKWHELKLFEWYIIFESRLFNS